MKIKKVRPVVIRKVNSDIRTRRELVSRYCASVERHGYVWKDTKIRTYHSIFIS